MSTIYYRYETIGEGNVVFLVMRTLLFAHFSFPPQTSFLCLNLEVLYRPPPAWALVSGSRNSTELVLEGFCDICCHQGGCATAAVTQGSGSHHPLNTNVS